MVPWLLNAALVFALQAPVLYAVGLHFDVFRRHNFLIAAIYALAALTLVEYVELGLIPAIGAAFGLSTLILVVAELGVFAPLERAGRTSDELIVATLGANIVLEQALSVIHGDRIQFPHPAVNQSALGAYLTTSPIFTALPLGLIGIILLAAYVARSETGARLTALGENVVLFRSLGFHPVVWRAVALVLIGLSLTLAAVAASNLTGAAPTSGFSLVVLGFVARLVGGPVHRPQFLLTCLLVVVTDQAAAAMLPGQWRTFALYASLLVLLTARARRTVVVD